MPQYLVSTYFSDNFDPSTIDKATVEGIHALNREMDAAGVTKFACGLGEAAGAAEQRASPHRRPVPGGQGTHGRIVDPGMRSSGRGAGVGAAQGRQGLRCAHAGRGAGNFLHAGPRKGLNGTAAAN